MPPALIEYGWLWLLCSFQGPSERAARANAGTMAGGRATRSLKTQQHARARARRYASLARPGSVDMLGRTVGVPTLPDRSRPKWRAGRAAPCRTGTLLVLPRKEVIQPHLQVRLPCYDFTPIASPTFADRVPQGVSCACFGYCRLSWCDGRCVQGPGTYSPRHADPRLLATPPSRSRVADCDPNLD